MDPSSGSKTGDDQRRAEPRPVLPLDFALGFGVGLPLAFVAFAFELRGFDDFSASSRGRMLPRTISVKVASSPSRELQRLASHSFPVFATLTI
jgi:hypothetical protein